MSTLESPPRKFSLLLKRCRQVLQIVDDDTTLFINDVEKFKDLKVLEDNIAIVVDRSGKICDIADTNSILEKYKELEDFERVLDLQNEMCVLPGLVDCHTHPVWDGDRVHEFAQKLAGATYMDIHKKGGGINFTVEKTREASQHKLELLFCQRLKRMSRAGTTTVECKSGYGLDLDNELKMLRVIKSAKNHCKAIDIVSTYCGAHAIPKGSTPEEATKEIIDTQIPTISKLQNELAVENIDVFCETGVFDAEQTRKILEEGIRLGRWSGNFHAEELSYIGGVEMGCKLKGVKAISHLERISEEGVRAMASTNTAAIILPTTAHILKLETKPPVRKMIENGVIVALGSDYNPNAPCLVMPIVMHLACITLHMSMNEAIVASTLNSAYALGKAERCGSIQVGKNADLIILKAEKWEELIYRYGDHSELIEYVIKSGKVVHNSKNKNCDF